MNESIIRRFAKYHGIAAPPNGNWTIEYIRCARSSMEEQWRHPGAIEQARERLIQTLTRIEDAEMLLARVESFSVPLLATSQEAKALREFYAFDAARLLAMAGIDPELWAKVKE